MVYIVMMLSIASTAACAYALYLFDLLKCHQLTLHQLETENTGLKERNTELERTCQEWAHDYNTVSTRLEALQSKPKRRALRLAARHRCAKTSDCAKTPDRGTSCVNFAKRWN